MEMVLSSGFSELENDEMMEVDGGASILVIGIIAGIAIIGTIVAVDLYNCYTNAYNAVIQSSGATVSGGDAI